MRLPRVRLTRFAQQRLAEPWRSAGPLRADTPRRIGRRPPAYIRAENLVHSHSPGPFWSWTRNRSAWRTAKTAGVRGRHDFYIKSV